MRLIVAFMCLCVLTGAFAQEPSQELQLSLGAGLVANDTPFRDNDVQTELIPLVDLHYKRFFVESVVAGYSLARTQRVHWKLTLSPSFQLVDRKQGSYTEGLHRRDISAMFGTQVDLDLGNRAMLSVGAKTDVLGKSDGTMANVELSRAFVYAQGRTILAPSLQAIWQNEAYNDYYFGVNPGESRPGRPAYAADAGLNYGVGAFFRQQLSDKLTVLALARYLFLPNEISDSPLVASDSELLFVAGATWRIK